MKKTITDERDIAIQITGLKKRYRLGVIGGGTLQGDIQSWWARKRGKEDPNLKIGQKTHEKNESFMALDGIDLTVYKGERIGIIGHNGAGKSTLLKLLSRVTAPTEGKIFLDGRIASMLEVGTGFNPELTGRENIYLNGAILGMTREEVDLKIDQIIDFSEVQQFIDTPVKRYSSGMYVKLAFSVAAHLDSEIMIMDEVLAVGDMTFQKKCLDKMNEVSKTQGRTILYVSHNMNTIRQLCDRVVVLNHGKIIFNGNVEEGVQIYFNVASDERTYIDHTKEPSFKWLKERYVQILSSEFVDKDTTTFDSSEELKIKITWRNLISINSLYLRVEFHCLDGRAVASSDMNLSYVGNTDEISSNVLNVDISTLMTGKYSLIYCLHFLDSNGNDYIADCVKGSTLEIMPKKGDAVWHSTVWGNCRLPMSIIQ